MREKVYSNQVTDLEMLGKDIFNKASLLNELAGPISAQVFDGCEILMSTMKNENKGRYFPMKVRTVHIKVNKDDYIRAEATKNKAKQPYASQQRVDTNKPPVAEVREIPPKSL